MPYLSLRAQLSHFNHLATRHDNQLRDLAGFTGYLGRVSYTDTQSQTTGALIQSLQDLAVQPGQHILAAGMNGMIYRLEADQTLTMIPYPVIPEPGNLLIEYAESFPERLWLVTHATATKVDWHLSC